MPVEATLQEILERFIAGAKEPALLDPGEEPLALVADQWSFSVWNGRLVLQAWDARRNLVRKITGLKEQRRDRLVLLTERFPGTQAQLQIADLAAPLGQELGRRTSRSAFRERFQLMLARQHPEWRIEEVGSEANLEQSLSPSYARAFLRAGSSGMAVMGAPHSVTGSAGIVAFGLIWLDYLRRREKKLSIARLLFYIPLGMEREVAFRVLCIDPAAVTCQLFAFDEKDRAGLIDLADIGNVDSTLPPCHKPSRPNSEAALIPDLFDVDQIEHSDGSTRLRVRGLEFARATAGKLSCGISHRKRSDMDSVHAMAREVARARNSHSEDCQHPLYSMNPEGWLESQVRANPGIVDASLRPLPLYGQVPVFSGLERGVIDLLGIDHTGRLVVIELKASADLQLPFQAIDYWLRVRKHLLAGDFEALGYFAGHVISHEAPRILLVAPALEFHSTTETLLYALAPKIEITRIGLAAGWRDSLRVMFRLEGAERPQASIPARD